MDTQTLITAQRQAHAAWVACPDRRKADKAALANALAATTRAVVDAKRAAAQPAGAQSAGELNAAVNAALARQKKSEVENALYARVAGASHEYRRAQEWPRCGERWPMDAIERAADALLRAHGADILGAGWDE